MEIKLYLADLAAYNGGRLIGEWITLPVAEEYLNAVIARLGHDGQTDIAIHDYEAPFRIGEYDDISALNRLAEILDDCGEDEAVLEIIVGNVSVSSAASLNEWVDEVERVLDDSEYTIYWDCQDMGDVAAEVVENSGLLDGVDDTVCRYFDYDAYGRDLEIEGTFIKGYASGLRPFYVGMHQ